MGRYEQALEYYRRLTDGLSPASWPGEYWRAELEYARCVVEAAAGDAQAIRNLGVRIRQLRMQDEGMGGLAEAFGQLERQAKDLAGESAR
jgi:tetratricopeptide (TPR) repeat protein